MKLPKYLICSNREAIPGDIILCAERPYYWGMVWRYKDPVGYADKLGNNSFLAYVVVDGYMIIISFGGSLDGTVEASPGIKKQLDLLLEDMKQFYYKEMIQTKLEFNKRFKRP